MLAEITVLISFAFIGAGLKYIDQVYDEGQFHKQLSWLMAVFCGILMGLLISFDPGSAILLLGITLGVAITGKLDNTAFHLVAVIAILSPVLVTWSGAVPDYAPAINWTATFLLMFAGAADEYLDAAGDRLKKRALTLRPVMKLGVLGMYFAGVFGFIYFLAMLAFDLSYIAMDLYSKKVACHKTHLTGNPSFCKRKSRLLPD